MRTILFIIVGIVGLSVPWHNLAAQEWKQETELLPQYCKDRAKKATHPAEWYKWRSTFGEVFIHMHHYCSGIYAEQKAKTEINKHQRNRLLRQVIGEMQYVGYHCNTDCVLYPELHTRLGWALGESGQTYEAIEQYQLAIKVKPNYSSAYAKLSDLYVKIKQPSNARKVLEAGLKAKPGSRKLQRRLREIETE
jgi:tetratricopeptide (TPR) repeat protein